MLPPQVPSREAWCEDAGIILSDPEPTPWQGSGNGAWISSARKLKEGNGLVRLPIQNARREIGDGGLLRPPRGGS